MDARLVSSPFLIAYWLNQFQTAADPKMQPTLRTQRLLLRPRSLADTDACVQMDQEPEVTRYVSGPWSDPVAHRAFVEQRTRGPYPDGLGYWSLAARDQPTEFVGWVLLIPVDAIGPETEIGWARSAGDTSLDAFCELELLSQLRNPEAGFEGLNRLAGFLADPEIITRRFLRGTGADEARRRTARGRYLDLVRRVANIWPANLGGQPLYGLMGF